MSRTLYIRPDKIWSLFGSVAAANGDPDHELDWLTDGRHGFPLRLNSGTETITITNAQGEVNVVAICHHLLDGGLAVVLGGDVSGAIEIPAYPENGVPFNGWTEVTAGSPTEVDTLTLAITGNSDDIVIGEVVAGAADELDPSLKIDDTQFSIQRFLNTPSGNPLSGIPPYSERAEARNVTGSGLYDQDGLDAILAWHRAQDAFPYPVPSLLILDSDDPTDARLVTIQDVTWRVEVPRDDSVSPPRTALYLVQIAFLEYTRGRW